MTDKVTDPDKHTNGSAKENDNKSTYAYVIFFQTCCFSDFAGADAFTAVGCADFLSMVGVFCPSR